MYMENDRDTDREMKECVRKKNRWRERQERNKQCRKGKKDENTAVIRSETLVSVAFTKDRR